MPKPEDRRPYRALSEPGHEWVVARTVPGDSGRRTCHTLRLVGWLGQSGAFYASNESPTQYEPGPFSEMWVEVEA